MRLRLDIEYDGTDFSGWAAQPGFRTVEGVLRKALDALYPAVGNLAVAGRTDAGVHALGQVAAFTLTRDIDADVVVRALNAHLPEAVRVLAAEIAAADFHPQFAARSKTYRYRIWNGHAVSPFERAYVWHVPGPLDVEAMAAAARLFEGTHDFKGFQGSGSDVKTTVRTVHESAIGRSVIGDALIHYEIRGDGFLRHMVRTIAGTLVEVGRGRRSAESMRELIAAGDRSAVGQTAPPHGLFLVRVEY